MTVFGRIMAALAVTGALGGAPAAATQGADASALAAALARADANDHAGAAQAAARASDPVVAEIAAWRRLLAGQGGFSEMRAMLDRRPDWPRMVALRVEAERAMPASLPGGEVVAFFGGRAPATGTGALRLAAAQGGAAGEATLAAAWTSLTLSNAEFAAFTRDHAALTRRLAPQRLDAMLWRGAEQQARQVLPLVDDGWRALAEARLALRARAPGVDRLIAAVPARLSADPGLAWERFLWRARSGREAEAEQLLMTRTGSAEALGRPDVWADRRATYARRAFRDGRVAEAYRLASQHHLTSGAEFADLEWLSGWIALQGMRDPARAAQHFRRHYDDVATPISLGRGGYWMGRAYEAMGDQARAREWYARGAEHPTSFYGQLAAEKIGRDPTAALAARDGAADWRPRLGRNDTARAISLLQAAGRDGDARAFVASLSRSLTAREDFAALGALATAIGRPDGAVVTGKQAVRHGHVLMDIYYPVVDVVTTARAVEPAKALAIARQESEMNPAAVSPAGARGLMQLMPATAQKVSRDLGVRYDLNALTRDPAYNVRLGQTYLAEMLARYAQTPMLAAAAYNAGPGRVDQWLGRYGDPRRPGVDPIDWIEHIPFYETRNYVHRVMEGLHIYRARLGAAKAPSYAGSLTRL